MVVNYRLTSRLETLNQKVELRTTSVTPSEREKKVGEFRHY